MSLIGRSPKVLWKVVWGEWVVGTCQSVALARAHVCHADSLVFPISSFRDQRTVFILQIARQTRPRDLEEFFSSVGSVRDVRIITDSRTRRSKVGGFSVIWFEVESLRKIYNNICANYIEYYWWWLIYGPYFFRVFAMWNSGRRKQCHWPLL